MGFEIIQLSSSLLFDHYRSYLDTLATLSPIGEHTQVSLITCFDRMTTQGVIVYVAIDEESKSIIGTISVLIEHKFNRGGSRVAHLEDLAVHPSAQGQGIGSKLILQAIQFAKKELCYKIILDADKDPAHVTYYEKFGFTNEGAYMKLSLL